MRARRLLRAVLGKDAAGIGIALLLLLVALWMPSIQLARDTFRYVVVFDLTQSMNVEDYELDGAPASRLAYARHSLRTILHTLPCGSRVGLGAFAEYRTVVVLAPIEVCGGYHDLLASLDNINARMRWGNASEVSKGLFWALRATRDLGDEANLVFLTDGHEAPPLRGSGLPRFDDLKPGAIRGWLLGVGKHTPRPIPKTDPDGRPLGFWSADEVIQPDHAPSQDTPGLSREHLSALREAYLRGLARELGLEYGHLTDEASLGQAMRDTRFARRVPVPTDLSWLPAALALLVLAVHFGPDFRRMSRGTERHGPRE